MKLFIEMPDYWGPKDVKDVARHLRDNTLLHVDRQTLASALENFIDVDVLMEAVRKS